MDGFFSNEEAAGLASAADECACLNLRKASRAVTRRFDEILDECGLRSTQLVILLELANQGSMSLKALSNALVMEKSSLSRTLKPLRNRGLIEMTNRQGSRQKMVSLTDRGAEELRSAIPLWAKAQTEFMEIVGAEWTQMRDKLGQIAKMNHQAAG